jgi:hypothetical protein
MILNCQLLWFIMGQYGDLYSCCDHACRWIIPQGSFCWSQKSLYWSFGRLAVRWERLAAERTLILITTQMIVAANLVLEHDFRI